MSSPAINSTLLVAALDLNLVQLLRAAMNTPAPGNAAGAGNHIAASSPNRASQHAAIRSVGIRNCDCPAATFEPSRVPHWHPRLNAIQPETANRPVLPVDAKPFIQPPWKTLPWPVATHAGSCTQQQAIKAKLVRTDVSDVGRTLDLFI